MSSCPPSSSYFLAGSRFPLVLFSSSARSYQNGGRVPRSSVFLRPLPLIFILVPQLSKFHVSLVLLDSITASLASCFLIPLLSMPRDFYLMARYVLTVVSTKLATFGRFVCPVCSDPEGGSCGYVAETYGLVAVTLARWCRFSRFRFHLLPMKSLPFSRLRPSLILSGSLIHV